MLVLHNKHRNTSEGLCFLNITLALSSSRLQPFSSTLRVVSVALNGRVFGTYRDLITRGEEKSFGKVFTAESEQLPFCCLGLSPSYLAGNGLSSAECNVLFNELWRCH